MWKTQCVTEKWEIRKNYENNYTILPPSGLSYHYPWYFLMLLLLIYFVWTLPLFESEREKLPGHSGVILRWTMWWSVVIWTGRNQDTAVARSWWWDQVLPAWNVSFPAKIDPEPTWEQCLHQHTRSDSLGLPGLRQSHLLQRLHPSDTSAGDVGHIRENTEDPQISGPNWSILPPRQYRGTNEWKQN